MELRHKKEKKLVPTAINIFAGDERIDFYITVLLRLSLHFFSCTISCKMMAKKTSG